MGLRYTRVGGGSPGGGPYYAAARKVQAIVEEELDSAGEMGVREGRRTITISGTGKSWTPGPWGEGGTGDRIKSGKMYDAIDYRIFHGAEVGLDVGWIRVWEEYFGYQDRGFDATGFRTPSANDHVAGMGVIAHLQVYMRDRVDEAMERAAGRIIDEL